MPMNSDSDLEVAREAILITTDHVLRLLIAASKRRLEVSEQSSLAILQQRSYSSVAASGRGPLRSSRIRTVTSYSMGKPKLSGDREESEGVLLIRSTERRRADPNGRGQWKVGIEPHPMCVYML
jgi:hypothetical protein